MWSPKRKMWSPRLRNVESKIAFLLQEISYFEPYLIQFTHRPSRSSCYYTVLRYKLNR